MREIVNAIFYILASGCAWRLMPIDTQELKAELKNELLTEVRRLLDGVRHELDEKLQSALGELVA